MMGVGTQLRYGNFPTAVEGGSSRGGGASNADRFFSPVAFLMGYRGRYESWGLEANVFAAFGPRPPPPRRNPSGGAVDFSGDGALQLHFLHYFDPRGLVSFYAGAGATFELLWFDVIRAKSLWATGTRSTLLDGGLDADLVFGRSSCGRPLPSSSFKPISNAGLRALEPEPTTAPFMVGFRRRRVELGVMF